MSRPAAEPAPRATTATATAPEPEAPARTTRLPADACESPRCPRVHDSVVYREHDAHTRTVAGRLAVVLHVNDPESPDSTVSLTAFTPGTVSGTRAFHQVRRGPGAGCWEFRD